MEIKLNREDVAKAIYVYMALKGQNADVTTLRAGISSGDFFGKPSLEYMAINCTNFEREVDANKLHKLVKQGKL